MIKEVTYYETSDGKQFGDKEEAKEHEIRLTAKVFKSEKDMLGYFLDKNHMFDLIRGPYCPPYILNDSRARVKEAVDSLTKEYPDIYVEHEDGLRKMFLLDFMWKQLKPHVVIRHFRISTPHEDKYTDEQIMTIYQFAEDETEEQDETNSMFDELIKLVDSLNE